MKILTEREKKILINHAKKQELRRIISKKKKKNKRRYLQGKSKEERQKYILENRFKDYSKIKAPSNFSLIENTEESLKFIAKIEKCLKNRSKVFVNLTGHERIETSSVSDVVSISISGSGLEMTGSEFIVLSASSECTIEVSTTTALLR